MGLLNDLQKFALRGNLVDMAIGFTVGAAFTTIAKSLVNDIIMPPIGLLLGSADFSDLFILLREGAKAQGPYATLKAAQDAGAITINFGLFINNIVAFVVVTLAMFFLIRAFNRLEERLDREFALKKAGEEEAAKKECPYCLTAIAARAVRCPACTSELRVNAG